MHLPRTVSARVAAYHRESAYYGKNKSRNRVIVLCTDQHRLVWALFRGRDALHLDDDFHGAATCVDDVTAKAEVAAGVERVEHV